MTDTDVLAHLAEENAWFADAMAGQKPLTDLLFTEMRGRIKEADRSVPQKDGQFLYWGRIRGRRRIQEMVAAAHHKGAKTN